MDTSYDEEEEIVEEARPLVPNHGIPTAAQDNRQPHEKQLAVYIILASTLFERIAFYTLSANIAFNLEKEKVGSGSPNGPIISFLFSGTSYISTIIFAVISDWKIGRAKTILVGFFLYIIGYGSAIVMTIPGVCNCSQYIFEDTSNPQTRSSDYVWCRVWILITLSIIAVGAGALQSNMAVFGAEQIQKSIVPSRYFDKYVVVINTSAIFAVLVIRSIYHDGDKQYFKPCIVAASALFVAALLFLIGWRYYIHVKSNETVITNCIPVVINAFQTWYKYEPNKRSTNEEQENSATSNLLNASDSLSDEEKSIRIHERPSTFLDFAKAANNGKFHDRIVDDVKSLRGALVAFTLLIPYWLIYNQLSSTFAIQGNYMLGAEKNNMVTYVWLGDPVTIIIGILLLNIFVYKHQHGRKRTLAIETKFVIGMSLAVVTMCMAGTVEKFRQDGCPNNCSDSNRSTLNLYYQLPQTIFMGFSEFFAMVASFEFAYFAAPRSAQTLFMSLRFCSLGISSLMGAAYFTVFSSSLFKLEYPASISSDESFFQCPPQKEGNWIFYTYFFVLAGLQLIFVIIFIVCQQKFRIIKLNRQQTTTSQFLQHSYTSSINRQ